MFHTNVKKETETTRESIRNIPMLCPYIRAKNTSSGRGKGPYTNQCGQLKRQGRTYICESMYTGS